MRTRGRRVESWFWRRRPGRRGEQREERMRGGGERTRKQTRSDSAARSRASFRASHEMTGHERKVREGIFSWLAKLSPLRVCAHQVGIVLPLSTPQPCRWRILPLAWRRDIPCGSAHQVARPEEFGRRCTIKCGLVLSGEKRIFVWKENLFSLFVTSARTPRAKAQPFKN